MTGAEDHLAIADAVDALPARFRRELAKGPMDEPHCRICKTLKRVADDNAQAIVEFHDLGDEELAEATHNALGTDKRLSRQEREAAAAYHRKLERLPVQNVQRRTVECLAANVMWWRGLYVYVLAGWRP